MAKAAGLPVLVCDRDHVIAASGIPKKEVLERRVSHALEDLMEARRSFAASEDAVEKLQPVEGFERQSVAAAPIIAAGDVCGAVLLLEGEHTASAGESEVKLIAVAAAFLGRQMEE